MTFKELKTDFLSDMLYKAIFIPEGIILCQKKYKFDITFVNEMDNQLAGTIWGQLLNKENKRLCHINALYS